ncbi:MAG: hypothetical protein ACE5IZ_04615 [Dehalococcoidia bacterium]
MASEDSAPELILGPHAGHFLSQAEPDERREVYLRLFSLLLDPKPDGVQKIDLNHFPYDPALNIRQLKDDLFLIIYRVQLNGDIWILNIFRLQDLPGL